MNIMMILLQPRNVALRKAHPNVMYRLRTKPSLLLLRLYNLFGSQSGLYADIALVVLECQTGLLGGFYSSYL